MTTATKLIFIIALVLSIIIPFGYYLIGEKNKKRYKRTIGVNAFFFFGAFAIASIMMLGGPTVHAADAAATSGSLATGLGYIAAALVTGLSSPMTIIFLNESSTFSRDARSCFIFSSDSIR